MTYPVWVNGRAEEQINPADRGLAYGDGVFETMLRYQGRVVLEEAHLARLARGVGALFIPLDFATLHNQLRQFLQACPAQAVIKILVTRGSSGRGYLADPAAHPTIVLSAHPVPPETASALCAGIADFTLARQPLLAGHKHLNRLEQVFLRQEQARKSVDELLVFDSKGFLVEGVSSNVFFVREKILHTPAITHAGVQGVMRQTILQFARQQGISAQEGEYVLSDVLAANELFFCNSVVGIRPVASLHNANTTKTFETGSCTQQLLPLWQSLRGE